MSDKLPIAEFMANNNKSSFTKWSRFFASRNLHLSMSLDVVDLSDSTLCECIIKKKAIDISENI